MKNKINTIIFDMDGVIFDTENMFLGCWRKIAEEYNISRIDEIYHQVIGLNGAATKAKYLEFYGADFAYDKLDRLAINMFHKKADSAGIPIKSGAVELLDYLSLAGYKIGLASSTRTEIVKKQLLNADLLKYFEVIIGGDMVEKSKPAPDIFLEACQQIGSPPALAYAIEDSFNGVRAAYAAGMKVIMVPDIVKPDEEMKERAIEILPDLIKVKEYLF